MAKKPRKPKFKPGINCPWCYTFDEALFEIVPINPARKEKFIIKGEVYAEVLNFECPECGCTFDKTKGAEAEIIIDEGGEAK